MVVSDNLAIANCLTIIIVVFYHVKAYSVEIAVEFYLSIIPFVVPMIIEETKTE